MVNPFSTGNFFAITDWNFWQNLLSMSDPLIKKPIWTISKRFCGFVPTGMAKFPYRWSLWGQIWLVPTVTNSSHFCKLCPVGRLATNKYFTWASFELSTVAIPTVGTFSFFFTKLAFFPTNHFPYATLFTLRLPVARRPSGDQRVHIKFHYDLWRPLLKMTGNFLFRGALLQQNWLEH